MWSVLVATRGARHRICDVGSTVAHGLIRREYDVAVVGLGGLGSAAAYWLARGGSSVVAFEQFELGHVRGASHDHSRIIRRSYHTPGYVALTAAAYETWQVVEGDADEQLITRTGGIDIFPPAAAIDPAPYRDSLDADRRAVRGARRRRDQAAVAGVRARHDDRRRRHRDLLGGHRDRASRAGDRRAAAAGGVPRRRPATDDTRAERAAPRSTARSTSSPPPARLRAGRVVVCADAWVNRLLAPLGHAIPLTVTREQVSYFPCHDSRPAAGPFPRVDLDARPELLRLPGLRPSRLDQGLGGLRRSRGRPRHAVVRTGRRHGAAAVRRS